MGSPTPQQSWRQICGHALCALAMGVFVTTLAVNGTYAVKGLQQSIEGLVTLPFNGAAQNRAQQDSVTKTMAVGLLAGMGGSALALGMYKLGERILNPRRRRKNELD